ncbi:hypothetical protein RIF29_19881 [Crotalaria pallida]|uniref:Uncharacterized protein n=1 Tax=Crotalaria pallida TaxID=3830 RepID=A0AAN9F1H9_CROPI
MANLFLSLVVTYSRHAAAIMARKKGKANASPTPSSSTRTRNEEEQNDPLKSLTSIDFSVLEDEDLAWIDNLSSKEADSLIRTLDAIKSRLKGKGVDENTRKESDAGGDLGQEAPSDARNWTQVTTRRRAQQRMVANQRGEAFDLRKLNKEHFARIDKREEELRLRLDFIQSDLTNNPTNIRLQEAEKETEKNPQIGLEQ